MAEPGWPAQEAHSGATTWQGGHAATWVPVWGAMCRLVIEGAMTKLIGESTPLFKRNKTWNFLRVGLCATRSLPVQVTWTQSKRRMLPERHRSRGPESTRSSNSSREQKRDLSDDDRRAHRLPRGNMRRAYLHQHQDRGIAI